MTEHKDQNPDTDSFPIIEAENPWDQAEEQRYTSNRSSVGPIIILAVLAVIAIGLAIGLWVWATGGDDETKGLAASSSSSSTGASTTTSTLSKTTTSTKSSTRSSSSTFSTKRATKTSSSTSRESSTTRSSTESKPAPPPIALGQAGQSQCGAMGPQEIWSGNSNTSCEFALEVGYSLAGARDDENPTIKAHSPITGQEYSMKCQSLGNGYFDCRGGDNAQVIIAHPGH